MKNVLLIVTAFLLMNFTNGDPHKTLEIGAAAPDFNLKGTDGKSYTLASFAESKLLVIVFTCNHCPTAQAYEERLKQLTADYKDKGVQVVAVSPNDPLSIRLDELGYSDLSDSYKEMVQRAKEKAYNFPYLFDGDTQEMSDKYGPVATPHVFIFDKKRLLRYSGRIDDVENPRKTPTISDTRNALDDLLADRPLKVEKTKTFGCSVKWAEKHTLANTEKEEWAKEPVTLNVIDEKGIKELLQNNTKKLLLVNVWATWCGPCVRELPDFMTMNRMYRRRNFEFISISADKPDLKDKALDILTELQMSSKNYMFNDDDIYKLIELVDPQWQGALPYTLLIEPNGKVIYRKQGAIVVDDMKKRIVDHALIGRVY